MTGWSAPTSSTKRNHLTAKEQRTMATKGTVNIYFREDGNGEACWYASYAYLDGEAVTIRMQPFVQRQASDAQLKYHADQGLRETMRSSGEPYSPTSYQIERR